MTRYEAMQVGAEWYTATRPCIHGHLSMRRTKDCECKECYEWRHARIEAGRAKKRSAKKREREVKAEEQKLINRQARAARRLIACIPDDQIAMIQSGCAVVIGRNAARMLGWWIYRTGQECARGHASWRFVKTGQCVECGAFEHAGPSYIQRGHGKD